MIRWQKITLVSGILTLFFVGYHFWFTAPSKIEQQNKHREPASQPTITADTVTTSIQPLTELKEKAQVCLQVQQERSQQQFELTAEKLTRQWAGLLASGIRPEVLYQQVAAIPELVPFLQNLFDELSHQLAKEQQLIVLSGTDLDFEQLFADIEMPAQEPANAQQWELTLSHFAASSNFYNMVFLNHSRHWHRSRVISPSLIFIANINKVAPAVASQLLKQLTFYPMQIAHAIEHNIDEHLLAEMLQRGELLQTIPLFRYQPDAKPVALNLADVALQAGRAELLPLLALYNIEPTQSVGYYSAIDNYLYGINFQNRQREMREQCEQLQACYELQEPQLLIIKQLAESGHQLHSLSELDGLPRRLLWLDAADALEAWQQHQQAEREDFPSAANVMQSTLQDASRQVMSDMPDCDIYQSNLAVLEAFWSRSQVNEILEQYQQRFSGTALLSALDELEPALLVALQQKHSVQIPTQLNRQEIRDYLALNRVWRSVSEIKKFTEQTALSAQLTDELLFWLIQYPEEIAIWQQRLQPEAPHSLRMFAFADVEQWQRLAANRFDFVLSDQYGLSIYLSAFTHQEAVSLVGLLLEQQVPVQHNQLGPDAIHLAIDWSYRHGTLFPLMAELFMQPVQLKESHYKRLRRLQLFYPNTYADLLQQVPAIQLPESEGGINYLSSLY